MRLRIWLLPLLLLLGAGCRPNSVWAPDGKSLALDPRGVLFTYNAETKEYKQHTRGPQKAVNPVWSLDGSRIAYYRLTLKDQLVTGADLMALDMATGLHTPLAAGLPAMPLKAGQQELGSPIELVRETVAAAWSPDGKRIAYTSYAGDEPTLWVANADGTNPQSLLKERQSAYQPAWSPDGARIAFLSSQAQEQGEGVMHLEMVRADGSDRKILWDGKARGTLATFGPGPHWTADGKAIRVFLDVDRKPNQFIGDKAEVRVIPLDGSEPGPAFPVGGPSPFITANLNGLVFFRTPSGDGEKYPRLAFNSSLAGEAQSLGELDEAAVGMKQDQAREMEGVPIPAISPDGKQLAVLVTPKFGKPVLLIRPTAPDGTWTRSIVPLATPAPPKAVVPTKKPPVKKPARKPARRRR